MQHATSLTRPKAIIARCRRYRRRRQQEQTSLSIPHCKELFNKYLNGVDVADQMTSNKTGSGSTAQNSHTKKWPVRILDGLLDIIMSNCWVIWRTLHPDDQHQQFRSKVALSFIDGTVLAGVRGRVTRSSESRMSNEGVGVHEAGDHEIIRSKRDRCAWCRYKSTLKPPRKSKPVALTHSLPKVASQVRLGCRRCDLVLCKACFHEAHRELVKVGDFEEFKRMVDARVRKRRLNPATDNRFVT